MSTTSVTAAQFAQVQAISMAHNVGGAWSLLASFGDQYVAAAYQGVTQPTSLFGEVARKAWETEYVDSIPIAVVPPL